MIKRALISVYDKKNLEELLEVLETFGVTIVSSGGTANKIKETGYSRLMEVADYTNYPESPGGLLKTLHPKIHGGLLLNIENHDHHTYMKLHNIEPFDLVCVNLYPFEEVVARGANLKEATENIDIGGPTMIRAAAKGALLYEKIAVVVDPSQYPLITSSLNESKGKISSYLCRKLANDAFKRIAEYDSAITKYLEEK